MEHSLLYLSQQEVQEVDVGMAEIITLVEKAFYEKGKGQVEIPPKLGLTPGDGDNFIHAMPASIPAMNAAGIKWVSAFPENRQKGLPYITGLLILNDPVTGLPQAVMDCVWITAMRTGAASAVAAKYLARPDSTSLGVLGCGVQGRSHAQAFKEVFPLEIIRAYDVDLKAAERFQEDVQDNLQLEVEIVQSPRDAVSECDMIVTAGPILKKPHQTILQGWLNEGSFASLVDYDSYWHPQAMKEVDKFCTDDTRQLQVSQQSGYFGDIPPIYADLGELVSGAKQGRESPGERTMTANLGLAIDDVAVAPTIYQRALEKGIGTQVPL